MMLPTPTLTPEEKRMSRAFQLLGDPTRYKIFKLLCASEELCVSEIASRLKISPSAVSQHFRNFEILGLVHKERSGQRICYIFSDNYLVKELKNITTIKE
jgi:DNA-binding transcriptional ArsR family regulator